MSKNPILNALAAISYISLVALIMFYAGKSLPKEDTFLAPIAAVSLFTLSAAVMGYLFLYQPFVMYFDNKKKAALDLFIKTLGAFAVVTVVIFVLLFSGVIKG